MIRNWCSQTMVHSQVSNQISPQKTCWVVFGNTSLLNWCSKTKSVLCQFYQMISLASVSNAISGTFTKPNQTMLQKENSPVLRYCCTSDPVRLVGPFHSPQIVVVRNKQKQHNAIKEYSHNKRNKQKQHIAIKENTHNKRNKQIMMPSSWWQLTIERAVHFHEEHKRARTEY